MSSLVPRSVRALAAVALSACHGATVAPKPPPAPLGESEPNDSAFEAPWYGTLLPGSRLAITGHVTSNGPDLYDGFAFTAGSPCTVRFVLRPSLPGTDLDLCVYDPQLDAFVACFDSPSGTEVGEIALAGAIDFHLVVSSAWADSSYLLEIETFPYLPAPEGSSEAQSGEDKGTLERVDGYRKRARETQADALGLPLATGWIGEVDLDTGHLARLPFAIHAGTLGLGTPR